MYSVAWKKLCIAFAFLSWPDDKYELMPELFYLDNFDQCMLKGEDALFCTFTFTLGPLGNSSDFVWNIIKNISSNEQNYRHDQLRHGICVPEKCQDEYNNSSSVEHILQKCYNQKYNTLGLKGSISQLVCQSNKASFSIDLYDIIYGSIMFSYIIFVIAASVYERYYLYGQKLNMYDSGPSRVGLLISAFSVPKNWERLRSTDPSSDHRKLRSIQGIRFYNMICVIMSHTIMGILGGPVSNPLYTEQSTTKVLNMFIANGWYVVQTFFVISGWLLTYHFFVMTAEVKNLRISHVFWTIINRYIRLAPAVAVMVGFHSTWLVHLSRGPYWDMFVGEEYRNCRKNWWTNLLFVNNYVDNNNMCLHQTWYIAADMQLFVLSVILLYFLGKNPIKIKVIFGLLLTIGFLVPGIIAYVNKYDIVIRQYPEVLYNLNLLRLDHWHILYSSAYSNIFGYTIGMVFGYLFYRYRNTCFRINRIHVILWWLLTFGLCIFMVLISALFYNPAFHVTPLKSAFYWASGKNLFALGIAIGIFGFTQKVGWFARSMCEFEPVQVLGRLTYSTYIIHVAFIRWKIGFKRYPASADDTMLFFSVLGDVAVAYLGGTLLCLLVEMPVSAIQKMLGFSVHHNRTNRIPKSSEKSLETLDLDGDNTKM
ncbi:nose resistant to fluoxetine protein 6-like isoform X2 [Anthonomus grandis grandis]|uniref:nose resistant to fluoxetine protein 6-like isoform X2 n=1 Tax=Anthonomus grandis grandis TaxID=2921223 RepID=UPI002166A586|nr:nose resistant to fluoxetine protein 6-like isoform X2 [Anthonomus grandis grandis]